MANRKGGRGGLVRTLALAKVRELRRLGLSYSRIGRLYGLPTSGEPRGVPRVTPERLLLPPVGVESQNDPFVGALDALSDGIAFFDVSGRPVHANRRWREVMQPSGEADADAVPAGATSEIIHFVDNLVLIARRSRYGAGTVADDVAVRSIEGPTGRIRLRGSYVGLGLFGTGPLLLVNLEFVAEDGTDQDLRERYGLTRQEIRTARLLAEGARNADIAGALGISPHTARHHTERVLRKLGVSSRHHVHRCVGRK